MPRRTQVYQNLPWTGGLNTALDSGIIPAGDLVQADNVIYANGGVKQKRQGLTYFNQPYTDMPTILGRSADSTADGGNGELYIVYSAAVSTSTKDYLQAGELIVIANSGNADYNGSYRITRVLTTNVTDDTIAVTPLVTPFDESYTADANLTVTVTYKPMIKLHEYWRYTGSAMSQMLLGVSEGASVYRYDLNTGNRKVVLQASGATARVGTAARAHMVTFNNYAIISFDRVGNTPLKYNPEADSGELTDLTGNPPDFSISTVYLQRIWTNDKNNRDRLHYSATGSFSAWQGNDDSGAIDIRPGDGDPEGITAIFPFKGRLFVAKRNKLYQIVGNSPENFQVVEVSEGLGIESHGSIAQVDQDDVLYISNKGIHSVATTSNYGDFQSSFLSAAIQPTFNDWELERLKFTQAAYVPVINAVVFNVAAESNTIQDEMWLYFTNVQKWGRWRGANAQSMITVSFSGKPTLFFCDSSANIIRTQNGTYLDFAATPITMTLKTGTVYPDESAFSVKAFKRLTVYFRPNGDYNFVAKLKIDNYQEQQRAFAATLDADKLDVDFILGSSTLGGVAQFAPFTASIDGMGRGFTLTIEQTGENEQVDVYGFAVEFEGADISQETVIDPESGGSV